MRKAVGSALSLGLLTEKEMKNIQWKKRPNGSLFIVSPQYSIEGGIGENTAKQHGTSLKEIEEYLTEHGTPFKQPRRSGRNTSFSPYD